MPECDHATFVKLPLPHDIVEAALAHERTAKRPGREVCGIIVVINGVADRFEPLRNWGHGDSRFRIHARDIRAVLKPGEYAVVLHSHPGKGDPYPSPSDLKEAAKVWLRKPYAILHDGRIRVFCIDRKGWCMA